MERAIDSATPRSSASGPGDAPGVSTKVTSGTPNRSASSISRIALRYPSGCGMPKLRRMFSSVSAPFCWPTTTTRRPSIRAKPADDRLVIAEEPVAVELHEVVGDQGDELQGARPAKVPGELDTRPDAALLVRDALAGTALAVAAGGRHGRPPWVDGAAAARPPRPRRLGRACDGCGARRSADARVRRTGRRGSEERQGGSRRRRRPLPAPRARRLDRLRYRAARRARRAARSGRRHGRRSRGSNRNSARWKPGGSSCAMVPGDTRAPAKPMSAFGSARLTSPTPRRSRTRHRSWGRRGRDVRHPALPQALDGGHRLGQLHQRERPLLHPGAAGRRDDDERDPLGKGRSAARVTFSPTTAPIDPPMNPKSMATTATRVPSMRPSPQTAASRRPVASCAAATRSGYGFWSTNPSGSRLEPGVALLERALVEQLLQAAPGRRAGSDDRTTGRLGAPSRAAC